MTWRDELDAILRAARGDVGLAAALAALRKVENGRPGREFGVLSEDAPTWDDQLRIAATSFRNAEHRYQVDHPGVALRVQGFYTDDFLTAFSARWAPLGATNDQGGLNVNHAPNLRARAAGFRDALLAAWFALA